MPTTPPQPTQSIVARTAFAIAALVCVTVLGAVGTLASDAVTALVTLLVGYVLGNGVLMVKTARTPGGD